MTQLPQDTFDLAARMLRKHTGPEELAQLIKDRRNVIDDIHTARPTQGLPGLGSTFWKHARFHTDDQARLATLVSKYLKLDPMEGGIITKEQCVALLGQWRQDVETMIGTTTKTPLYSFKHGPVEFGNLSDHPVMRLELQYNGSEHTWQNGKTRDQPEDCNIWWHATRSSLVPSILSKGLKATIVSHGYKGLWVNTHAPSALSWTVNPFDLFPTVLFQLNIQKDILVHNSAVQAGSIHRSVACTPYGETLPNIQIVALIIRIPTMQHRNWQLGLRNSIMMSIHEITQYDEAAEEINAEMFQETWQLTSWRVCYYGSTSGLRMDFGGPFDTISPLAANLSLTLTEIIAGLSTKNVNTRLRHLYNVPLDAVPKHIRLWLNGLYPHITDTFSLVSPSPVETGRIWQFHTKFTVLPWRIVDYPCRINVWI